MSEAKIPYVKMHGCGNDFVMIDNRSVGVPQDMMSEWAVRLCHRTLGIGADGLIFLDATPPSMVSDYIWHFYNADGSRGEMCGNGARCAALLAVRIGLAGNEHRIGTDAGPVLAEVDSAIGEVRVQLTRPKELRTKLSLDVEGMTFPVHYVNTGVPHVVVLTDNIEAIDVENLGRAIRYHGGFEPDGTNANFVQIEDRGNLLIRTYERGVEAETYACGTGCCAAVVVANTLGHVEPQVTLRTALGDELLVTLSDGEVFLQGPAVVVHEGVFYLSALGLDE